MDDFVFSPDVDPLAVTPTGVRIDALDPTVTPSGGHELAAMKDGLTTKIRVDQILSVSAPISDAPADGKLYGRNGQAAQWQAVTDAFVAETGPAGAGILPVGTTAQRPAAGAGRIRFNIDTQSFEGCNAVGTWAGLGGGVYVGVSPPAGPRPGDLWWKSDTGLMLIYYDDGNTQQWVVATPAQDQVALDARYKQIADGGVFKINSGVLGAGIQFLDIPIPVGFHTQELYLSNISPVSDAQQFGMRFSMDGSTFPATNYNYQSNYTTGAGTNTPAGAAGSAGIVMGSWSNLATVKGFNKVTIPTVDAGACPIILWDQHHYNGTLYNRCVGSGLYTGLAGPMKAVRFYFGTGNFVAGLAWQLNGIK
jgi:hypothetical protein